MSDNLNNVGEVTNLGKLLRRLVNERTFEKVVGQELPAVNSASLNERMTLQPGGKHPEGPLTISDSAQQPVLAAPVIATLRECNVLLDRRLRMEREAELIATEQSHLFCAAQHIGAAGKAPRTSSWDISQAIAALLKAREAAEELDPPAAA